ncbi:hypothetical protein D3C79_49520 [compost metagenome]
MSDKVLAARLSLLGKMGVYTQNEGIYNKDKTICLKLSGHHYNDLNEYSFWLNGVKVVTTGVAGKLMWPDEFCATTYTSKWVFEALADIFTHWLTQPKSDVFSLKSYLGEMHEIIMHHIALGVYSHHVDNLTEYDVGDFLVRVDKDSYQCGFYIKRSDNLLFSLSDLDRGATISVHNPNYEVTGTLIVELLKQFTVVLECWYRTSGLVDTAPVKGLQVGEDYFVNPTYLAWLLVRQRNKTSSNILGLATSATHRIAADLAQAKGWDVSTIHVDGLCISKGMFGFNMHQVTKVRITEAL